MSGLMVMFLIMALGYVVGYINFFGIKFGASAILIISLIFGHFGYDIPDEIGTIGLVLFLAPIGLMAGSTFLSNIKRPLLWKREFFNGDLYLFAKTGK